MSHVYAPLIQRRRFKIIFAKAASAEIERDFLICVSKEFCLKPHITRLVIW